MSMGTAVKPAPGVVTLRPTMAADLPFLARVYASTRSDIWQLDWTEEEQRKFLAMQFAAQHKHYQARFPNASFKVIEIDGQSAGRLYLDRSGDVVRIIDIALLPDFRRQGIGSQLLDDIIGQADKRGATVRIHVEQDNPALALYQRVGFREIARDGIYRLMERLVPAQ